MKQTLLLLIIWMFYSIINAQELPPKQAYPLEVRQIHSGHSLTDPLFGQPWPGQYVNLITHLRGVWAGDDIGKATIPGSPMFWRWDNEHTLSPSARYDIEDWELLVITEGVPIPIDWDNPPQITPAKEYLSLYMNNAWNNGHGGDGAATLLWTTWTNIDDSNGPWRATLDAYELLWEEMMDYANDNRPEGSTPLYLIPGHRMMARIYDDIELNAVPGITHINQIFSDNIHTNSLGDYAIAMIHYACIFNQSPVGLPNDLMPNPPAGFQIPSPALALYFQTIVWEIVTTYARTGITDGIIHTSESEESNNAILIYPNPTNSLIFIIENQTKETQERKLYDSTGRLVYSGFGREIDLSSLPSGIYELRIGNLHRKVLKE